MKRVAPFLRSKWSHSNKACKLGVGWSKASQRHFLTGFLSFQWIKKWIFFLEGCQRGKIVAEIHFHFFFMTHKTTEKDKHFYAICYRKGSVSPPTSPKWGECISYLLRTETSVHCYIKWGEHLGIYSGETCTVSRNPLSGRRNAIRNLLNNICRTSKCPHEWMNSVFQPKLLLFKEFSVLFQTISQPMSSIFDRWNYHCPENNQTFDIIWSCWT